MSVDRRAAIEAAVGLDRVAKGVDRNVSRAIRLRLVEEDEAARLAASRPAKRPRSVSDFVLAVPARRPLVAVPQFETVITPTGSYVRRTTEHGEHPARETDVFDRMIAGAAARGGSDLTEGMVRAGRFYAALVERLASSGIRCSSLEALVHRQAGGGSWIDAVIRDSRRRKAIEAAIGDGLALDPSGARAHLDRAAQRQVTDRDLVRLVCIGQLTAGQVCRATGWAENTRNRRQLMNHLCAALDRMQDA